MHWSFDSLSELKDVFEERKKKQQIHFEAEESPRGRNLLEPTVLSLQGEQYRLVGGDQHVTDVASVLVIEQAIQVWRAKQSQMHLVWISDCV